MPTFAKLVTLMSRIISSPEYTAVGWGLAQVVPYAWPGDVVPAHACIDTTMEFVPAWKPEMVVELVMALRVVVVLEYEKTVDVEVVVDVTVFVVVWPPFVHPEGQYSEVNVFPLDVSKLTYTLPDVRQPMHDAACMPIAHPKVVPQPARERVPSPTAKVKGKVTFKSPASLDPPTRNSDPR